MAGTKEGGLQAAETNKKKYGKDFYAKIGAKGGKNSRNGGFACKTVGKDGLTGPERAHIHGAVGGRISRRPKSEKVVDSAALYAKERARIDKAWRQRRVRLAKKYGVNAPGASR